MKINSDNFLYCDKHNDLWQVGCPRCEQCSQHHYGESVQEHFQDDGSLAARSKHWKVYTGNTFADIAAQMKKEEAEK